MLDLKHITAQGINCDVYNFHLLCLMAQLAISKTIP